MNFSYKVKFSLKFKFFQILQKQSGYRGYFRLGFFWHTSLRQPQLLFQMSGHCLRLQTLIDLCPTVNQLIFIKLMVNFYKTYLLTFFVCSKLRQEIPGDFVTRITDQLYKKNQYDVEWPVLFWSKRWHQKVLLKLADL